MTLHPMLSTLRRHKTAAGLIALEIAFTCAIVSNAVFLIGERLERMARPSGVAENELILLQLVGMATDGDAAVTLEDDLAALRALPGVRSVAVTNQIPFGRSSWNSSLTMEPEQAHPTANVTTYIGSHDLVETLGVNLVGGRDFLPEEHLEFESLQIGGDVSPPVIITRALAERAFPEGDALGGRVFLWGSEPSRVIGIIDHLARPNEEGGEAQRGFSVILPVSAPAAIGSNYLLRVEPDRREALLAEAADLLQRISPNRILLTEGSRSLADYRADYYRQDLAMAWLLVAVCVALLVVTSLGIVGLASFWVQQRTRQIGIRRALGATRGQVLRYFQVENFLIASLGIALGMALAFAINASLMSRYEIPRLPWTYLPLGAICLWLLGQAAVLGPALRAARVPPALATRSA